MGIEEGRRVNSDARDNGAEDDVGASDNESAIEDGQTTEGRVPGEPEAATAGRAAGPAEEKERHTPDNRGLKTETSPSE
ncbi:hypothetical protein [Arthrobacter castelli]|uniref:hypothetical protein n=1 Tax=Arthrobacter castelli TaxID=271431 RepID=UPI00041F806E|nr:hypothetical protein [Arthrobacter castelli]